MADCFKEAVCVDCGRVYDSCCDRDCLEDLRVYFSPADQETVNNSAGARVRSCEILNVCIEVEPVTFNRGYYSVDMVFYFQLNCDVYPVLSTTPVNLNGIALGTKRSFFSEATETLKPIQAFTIPTAEPAAFPQRPTTRGQAFRRSTPLYLTLPLFPFADATANVAVPSLNR